MEAASRGLTYPMKSSIVRNLLAQSRAFANLAGGSVLALVSIDIGIFNCLYVEIREGLAGNCKP
jgi:hypothetical protein